MNWDELLFELQVKSRLKHSFFLRQKLWDCDFSPRWFWISSFATECLPCSSASAGTHLKRKKNRNGKPKIGELEKYYDSAMICDVFCCMMVFYIMYGPLFGASVNSINPRWVKMLENTRGSCKLWLSWLWKTVQFWNTQKPLFFVDHPAVGGW
jgi:hypothetical protein